jgi:putative aldouronate transport system permease protein
MKKKKYTIRKSVGDRIFDLLNIAFMLAILGAMTLPMVHVLAVSLSSGPESIKSGFFFWPKGGINFTGYQTVFRDSLLMRSYLNTIIYSVGSVLFTLFFTSLTAYPLSIPGFRLKKAVTIFLTITMFIGGGMIPTYMLIRQLHLINTLWVMMIPFCVGAYNVILFRTFFSGLPESLREAAIIDGATEFKIFLKIYMPLSKAIFATIGLFTFVGKWNDWFSALLYLSDESKYPLQMILRKILFNNASMQNMDNTVKSMMSKMEVSSQNIKMAAIIITILPVLCVYPFLQKYFVKGVFVGTVKG